MANQATPVLVALLVSIVIGFAALAVHVNIERLKGFVQDLLRSAGKMFRRLLGLSFLEKTLESPQKDAKTQKESEQMMHLSR